jgi:hypothetical protein
MTSEARKYQVQVVTVGTHEPIYAHHKIVAPTPAIAALEAKLLNCGLGGLGRVDVISVEEAPCNTPKQQS